MEDWIPQVRHPLSRNAHLKKITSCVFQEPMASEAALALFKAVNELCTAREAWGGNHRTSQRVLRHLKYAAGEVKVCSFLCLCYIVIFINTYEQNFQHDECAVVVVEDLREARRFYLFYFYIFTYELCSFCR